MDKEELTSKDSDWFLARVVVVCIIAIVLLLLLVALTSCSNTTQPVIATQPQELTAEQQILKARYLENLRKIFYGDNIAVFRAIEITHLNQIKKEHINDKKEE